MAIWSLFKALSGLPDHPTPDNTAYGESGLGSNSGLYARVASSVVVGSGKIGLEPSGGAGLYPSLHQSPGIATVVGAVEVDAGSFADLSLGSGRYGFVQENGRNFSGSIGVLASCLASLSLFTTSSVRLRKNNLTINSDLTFSSGVFPEGLESPSQANVAGGTVSGSTITASASGKNGGVLPTASALTVRTEWLVSGTHRLLRLVVFDRGDDYTNPANNYWDIKVDLTAQYGVNLFNSGPCTFYCACDNSTNGATGVFTAFRMYRDVDPASRIHDGKIRITGYGAINAGLVSVERKGYGLLYPQVPVISTSTGSGGEVRTLVSDTYLRGVSVENGGTGYSLGDYVTVASESSDAPTSLRATIPSLLATKGAIRVNWVSNPTGVWPLTYTLTRMASSNSDENDTTGGTVIATVNPLSRASWKQVEDWITDVPPDGRTYLYHLKTVDSSGTPVTKSAFRAAKTLSSPGTVSLPNPLHFFNFADSIGVSLEGIAAYLGGSSLTGDSTGYEFYGDDPVHSLLWLDNALSFTTRRLRDRLNVEVHGHNVAISGATINDCLPNPTAEAAYYLNYTSGALKGTAIPSPGRNYKEFTNRVRGTTWSGFDPNTDLFVIHIALGMNDLRTTSSSVALARLKTLLTALASDFPGAIIVVSEVTFSPDNLAFPNIIEYNEGRADVVFSLGNNRVKVGAADLYNRTSRVYPQGYIRYPYGGTGAAVADHIHPTLLGGYREVGYGWYENIFYALEDSGVLAKVASSRQIPRWR